MVVMGRIVAPYGVKGWVKIQPFTEMLDGLFDYENWWIASAGEWVEFEIDDAKVHSNVILAKPVGSDDRDSAFALKGKDIAVPRESLPVPEEGDYYWSDLIKLSVFNVEGVELGKVQEVFETGANDVLVVKGDRERLIPFTGQTVLEVNLEAGYLRVDWDSDF